MGKQKKIFWIACMSIFVIVLIFIALAWYFYHLPYGCEYAYFETGCQILEDGDTTIKPQSNEISYYFDNKYSMRQIAFVLRTLDLQKTDDQVTDVQYIRFSFRSEKGEVLWCMHIVYDFYQQKVYVQKNGEWYCMKESELLNQLVSKFLSHECIYPGVWKGQSTYAKEEFVDSDFENPTFRYHLYWNNTLSNEEYTDRAYRNSNFRNTEPTEINTPEDALVRAAVELAYEDPVGYVFYDKTCGYWLVELYDNKGYSWDDLDAYGDFLFQNVQTVVLNDCGVTLEVYRDVTRFRPFWENCVITIG